MEPTDHHRPAGACAGFWTALRRGAVVTVVASAAVTAAVVLPAQSALASKTPRSQVTSQTVTGRIATGACIPSPQDPKKTSASVSFPLASYEIGTGTIKESSPTIVTVTGASGAPQTVIVVGDENGVVQVIDASTCQELPGWPQSMAAPNGQHAVIESSPTVAYLDGPSLPPSIIVGSGSTWVHTNVGEIEVFNWNGTKRFIHRVHRTSHNDIGVFSTAAVGNVTGPGGGPDIVFGSWDYYIYVIDANGSVLAKYHNAETVWSSPALYRLPGRTADDIYIGNDKTNPGVCVGGFITDFRYHAVAHSATGLPGVLVPVWQHCQGKAANSDLGQAIWSSPAVGVLRPDGPPVVVVGTSFYEKPFGDGTNKIYAYNAHNGAPINGWPVNTLGPVLGSPAIGVIDTSGDLGVVDTSFVCAAPIQVDSEGNCFGRFSEVVAFSARGVKRWAVKLLGPTDLGSPILVPLVNHGGSAQNDVLVGSGDGLFPIAGSTGAFLYGTDDGSPARAINPGCQIYNAPAAADVMGSGKYTGWYGFESCDGPAGDGVYAFALPYQPTGSAAWPMFHDNPQHTGTFS